MSACRRASAVATGGVSDERRDRGRGQRRYGYRPRRCRRGQAERLDGSACAMNVQPLATSSTTAARVMVLRTRAWYGRAPDAAGRRVRLSGSARTGLGVDAQLTHGALGHLDRHLAAAGQLGQGRRHDVGGIHAEEPAQRRAGVAPAEAVGAQAAPRVARDPARDHVRPGPDPVADRDDGPAAAGLTQQLADHRAPGASGPGAAGSSGRRRAPRCAAAGRRWRSRHRRRRRIARRGRSAPRAPAA